MWMTGRSIELSTREVRQKGIKPPNRLVQRSGTNSRMVCKISTGSLNNKQRSLCARWRIEVALARVSLMDPTWGIGLDGVVRDEREEAKEK